MTRAVISRIISGFGSGGICWRCSLGMCWWGVLRTGRRCSGTRWRRRRSSASWISAAGGAAAAAAPGLMVMIHGIARLLTPDTKTHHTHTDDVTLLAFLRPVTISRDAWNTYVAVAVMWLAGLLLYWGFCRLVFGRPSTYVPARWRTWHSPPPCPPRSCATCSAAHRRHAVPHRDIGLPHSDDVDVLVERAMGRHRQIHT